jgi:Lipocalin-like domain
MIAPRLEEHATLASRLVGAWTLHRFVDEQAGRPVTEPFGSTPKGLLIYTAEGLVSAQLMKQGRASFHSPDWLHATPEEYQDSASGYIAYSGTYEVDEVKRTVTHLPFVALLPNLLTRPQLRAIDLQGDRLVLRTAGRVIEGGTEISSRLEWLRLAPNHTLLGLSTGFASS